MLEVLLDEQQTFVWAYRSGSRHWTCASEGRRPRARARFLLRSARIRTAAEVWNSSGIHFRGWLSPPHWPKHLGKQRRLAACARNNRTVSRGHSISDEGRTGRCLEKTQREPDRARRGKRSRRQRGALSA